MVIDDRLVAEAGELGRALMALDWRIVCAESCTGGLICAALTETAGSSNWFDRGYVTYSNDSKQTVLGIPQALLDQHGAVSEPVARAMAQGALARSRARLALAVTGIAGPGGGSPGKPVGTVCFAWAMDQRVESHTRHFSGDRGAVRHQTALHALARARAWLPADPAGRALA